MEEIWKDIEGYEGLYQVSNLGRVKSLERVVMRSDGQKYSVPETFRKTSLTKDGYERISLTNIGKRDSKLIHRLVALAFLPNPENKETVNHIDGNKTNNIVTNLEWNTRLENMSHAHNILGIPSSKGTKNGMSKLTNNQIKYIRLTTDKSKNELAKELNVSRTTISRILLGKGWTHI